MQLPAAVQPPRCATTLVSAAADAPLAVVATLAPVPLGLAAPTSSPVALSAVQRPPADTSLHFDDPRPSAVTRQIGVAAVGTLRKLRKLRQLRQLRQLGQLR